MKFLDLNGLTHFFGKVKTWTGNNYLSLKGGNIDGTIKATTGFVAEDPDNKEVSVVKVQSGTGIDISVKESGNPVIKTQITKSGVYAPIFKKNNGTPTQVLIADGSVKEIGSANGVAGLDANGNVPLSQLGNLDTTVAEVVTALPTTNIKKHIYLIKDTGGVTQNQYEEYIYTGNISATYDASKWEKLGDFRATVDLADYAKKSEAVNKASYELDNDVIRFHFKNINDKFITGYAIPSASSTKAGVMSANDKSKLNRLDISDIDGTDAIYISSLITADGIATVDSSDNSILVTLPSISKLFNLEFSLSAATNAKAGVMTAADKTKLDGIASGATVDSAITTAEIDALFA